MQNNKTIAVITDGFPYDLADGFLHDEFKEIKKNYSQIHYFPLSETGPLLFESDNQTHLHRSLIDSKKNYGKNLLFKNVGVVFAIFFQEFFRSKKTRHILTHLRPFFRSINQALHLAEALKSDFKKLPKDCVIYSTWMNSGALALAILKYKKIIEQFSFRINGFDIFDERHVGNYMPFRVFNFRQAHKIVVLSSVAHNYLLEKKIYPNKLVVNYSGIYPNALNPFDASTDFTLISCSNLFEWKRVGLIANALKFVDFKITWIHIGDGLERKLVDDLIAVLPQNVTVKMLGHFDQNQINQVYQNTPINLFIHVSRTEGLGMAIIEAQSYGIPQLCCAAGGVVDVVSEQTGTLIPVEATPQEIASQISQFRLSEKNTVEFRQQVQNEFKKKFNITDNFKAFMKVIE